MTPESIAAALDARIARVEWALLDGERPRKAGSNARLGDHGRVVRLPIARLTTEDGAAGYGFSRAQETKARELLGLRLDEVFAPDRGPLEGCLAFEYPLWDLTARRCGVPTHRLAARIAGSKEIPAPGDPVSAHCYDTSLYFDDLHLTSEADAAALIAEEALDGCRRGHRAFKIKVGRGARHMPLEAGTRRDIAIVRSVRQAVGPACPILLDANNGYNLNLTKHVLSETADCGVFWIEEAFHEDPVLYRDLREWLKQQGLPVLIADGEGQASPSLMDWAREKLIDVVQYDVLSPGFTKWLQIGRQLDEWGARSAPHHYGAHYGNYAASHLVSAIRNFAYVEWDEVQSPALDASKYSIREGEVILPEAPGFGLELDESLFRKAVQTGGFEVRS